MSDTYTHYACVLFPTIAVVSVSWNYPLILPTHPMFFLFSVDGVGSRLPHAYLLPRPDSLVWLLSLVASKHVGSYFPNQGLNSHFLHCQVNA